MLSCGSRDVTGGDSIASKDPHPTTARATETGTARSDSATVSERSSAQESPSEGRSGTGALHGRVRRPEGARPSEARGEAEFLSLSGDFVTYRKAIGADGSFAFDELTPGEGWLSVRVPGCALLEQRVSIQAGSTTELVLDLPFGVVLAGRVVDERGSPLSGARVDGICCVEGGDEVRASFQVLTDQRGEFRIDQLPAGDIRLWVSITAHRGFRQEFGPLGPADARLGLEIVLADGSDLGGRVLVPDGALASAVTVFVESEGGWESQQLESDAEGRFLAHGLGDGPFRVTAISRPEPPLECELVTARAVPAGTLDLELRLSGTGAIETVVRGASAVGERTAVILDFEGVPAGSAPNTMRWMDRICWDRQRTTDGERICGLEPGVYWLEITDLERSLAALQRVEVREGETAHVEVELVPATWLEVTALREQRPVPFALVIRSAGGYLDRVGFATDVGIAGVHAERSLLPPGTYQIELSAGGRRAAAEVTLSGEPKRELRLELE